MWDRIEVLKGPAAFLYGGNPLSGTAHLIRKQPEYSDLFEVRTSYGSYNSYVGSMDWNYGKSDCDLAFRLNGTWQNSSGYRDDLDSSLLAVNPALTWRIDGDSFLNMNFEFVSNEYSPDSGLPLIGDEIADVPRHSLLSISI
jgi:outer membrane receptor protein involved in Fe transport